MWFDTDKLEEFWEKIDKVSRGLEESASKFPSSIQQEFAYIGNEIRTTIIESMRDTPKTGRSYPRPGGKIHIASSPGNPPAIDYGDLVNAIAYEVRYGMYGAEMQIGSKMTAPHGYWMEKGTRGLAMGGGYIVEPRPWLVRAVEGNMDRIKERIGDVVMELVENPLRGVFSRSVL